MRVGIVGLGMAGAALACLLHDQGHQVTVLERADDPRPVGAGIWLQALGQQVLARLELLDPLRALSRDVSRVEIVRADGRALLDMKYAELPGSTPALGVHRGDLFMLLHDAVRSRDIPVELGVHITGVAPSPSGSVPHSAAGGHGAFDLVVGCDGSGSRVREGLGVTRRNRPYEYGALWAIVDDPDGLATDRLYQRMRGTREYLGVLPTGQRRSSLFWSIRRRDMPAAIDAGLRAWRSRAIPLAGRYAPLLERVTELLPATYRDVVVRTPYRLDGSAATVLIGDAAHAMSPQLGAGTSLALADAWSLAGALRRHRDLASALPAYAADRAAHTRWYQWCTRLLMPAFQSDLTPLGAVRDALSPTLSRPAFARRLMLGNLCGDRTSPWTSWTLPDAAG